MSTYRFGIVGLGRWGQALGTHLHRRGFDVAGWSRSCPLDLPFRWEPTLELLSGREVLVLALPAKVLTQYIAPIQQSCSSSVIVSAVKGLTAEGATVAEVWRKSGGVMEQFAVLGGPLFAAELLAEKVGVMVIGAFNAELAESLAQQFEAPFLRIYLSRDPVGIELGGIIKNVIAIATGMSDGLGFGESVRAAILTRGLAEMVRFAEPSGGDERTMMGLGGLGDLLMTGTSRLSRNWQVGYYLGQGMSLSAALTKVGETAEGITAAPLLANMAIQFNISAPITAGIAKLLRGECTCSELAKELIERPRRFEY